MKMIKSLVLGSAAGLIAMGGAQAADLPVKAKAVEYVKICSLYGAGFYYIPGTDTCIKLGGYLRVDMLANAGGDATNAVNSVGGANNRFTNGYIWRSREDFNIDTRTATEYGVVRTFADLVFSWTNGNYNQGTTLGTSIYDQVGSTGAAQAGNGSGGLGAAGALGVYYAFIQFAGFTMGKAISQFSAPWTNYPGNNFDGLVGGGGTVTGVQQFNYTVDFGNGVSGNIGVQDQTQYYQAGLNNLSAGGMFGTSNYAGTIAPDIVGMIRVDQAWGLFQASVAAHDNHAAYYGGTTVIPGAGAIPAPLLGTEAAGHPDDKWGWAVALAMSIKNIPTGPGDTINIQGVYTDGATRYNIQDLASTYGAMAIYGSSGSAYQSVGYGTAPDTVFANGTQQQLVQTWGMRGAYTHNWDPYWNSSIYGAYAAISYNGVSKAMICGNPTWSVASVTSCNPDYNIAQLGFITRWTPVKNLTFSADVLWTHLDQKMAGTINAASAGIAKPTAVYELKDQDTVALLLRAQRNW